jgi:Ohr subfamily peroxiredoxin
MKEDVMNRLEKVLYTARAHATGGRSGMSRSSDGRLEVKLSRPGSPGTGTNPEQLFAAGWSACFDSAMEFAARNMKITLPADHAVDVEIDLGPEGGAFSLVARLYVSLPVGLRVVKNARKNNAPIPNVNRLRTCFILAPTHFPVRAERAHQLKR